MHDGPKVEFLDTTWRPPAGGKRTGAKAAVHIGSGGTHGGGSGPGGGSAAARAKLQRLASHAPEVMVKVSGRQRGGGHTAAHLEYIGRHGKLEVETSDGERLESAEELRQLAQEWAEDTHDVSRRREPLTSVSMVLSMPPGTNPDTVYQAARAFARVELERFPYAMALHTDADHPHVHVTVAARGEGGERFNPRKGDLAMWRESFARELRARGIEAEATPRRARGVIRRTERTAVRKMRERAEAGTAEVPRVLQASEAEAAAMLRESPPKPRPWEVQTIVRQSDVRASYQKAAELLEQSGDAADRALARQTRAFVASMPGPATRDRALAQRMATESRAKERESSAGRTFEQEFTPSRPADVPTPKRPDRER